MIVRSPTLNVMIAAAEKAARSLRRDFGEVEQLQVSLKGPADFVSTADLKAEKILRLHLQKGRPYFGLLMEEGGSVPGTDPHHRWIVDPLDGTSNFMHGLPHFAISIALERDQEILAGLILDPIKNELFWAEKGGGAWLNDRRLRISGRRKLAECLIATGIPHLGHGDKEAFLGELPPLMAEVAGIRRFGAAALDLAYVAAGRYEGFWERHLQPWDIAAGLLLVQEAGGLVSEIEGGGAMLKSGNILATNGHIHNALTTLLKGNTPKA